MRLIPIELFFASVMSTTKKTATQSALEQIETEIKQIDQIVKSWSDGKSLRFDKAHVNPQNVAESQADKRQAAKTNSFFNLAFFANLGVMLVAIGLTSIQSIYSWLTQDQALITLTSLLVLLSVANIVFNIRGSSIVADAPQNKTGKKRTESKHPGIRSRPNV